MLIHEIFHSIQGEGEYMGVPVVFVRTWGCDVHCTFCDTKDSWQSRPEFVKDMDINTIVGAVKILPDVRWVVVTGGEPTIQLGLSHLVNMLHDEGYQVALETSGSHATVADFDWITVSPKPPLHYEFNIDHDRIAELKYVVTRDFKAEEAIPDELREEFKGHIWLQPDGFDMDTCMEKCRELAAGDCRLRCGVQLHKIYHVM